MEVVETLIKMMWLESQEGLKQVALEVGKYFGCGELESQERLKHQAEGISLRGRHVWH